MYWKNVLRYQIFFLYEWYSNKWPLSTPSPSRSTRTLPTTSPSPVSRERLSQMLDLLMRPHFSPRSIGPTREPHRRLLRLRVRFSVTWARTLSLLAVSSARSNSLSTTAQLRPVLLELDQAPLRISTKATSSFLASKEPLRVASLPL